MLMALVGWLLYERRERRKAERDSRRSLAMAAHAGRAVTMSALSGSIGHELGQPLGSIRLNADAAERLIASNRATPEELRDILRDIGREDDRATQIIGRLRAMMKKTQDIDKRPLDIFAVVRESLAIVAHDASARRVQIDCRLPSAPCLVLGDQVLLQQVMINLVLNAFDAMADADASADRRIVIEATARRCGRRNFRSRLRSRRPRAAERTAVRTVRHDQAQRPRTGTQHREQHRGGARRHDRRSQRRRGRRRLLRHPAANCRERRPRDPSDDLISTAIRSAGRAEIVRFRMLRRTGQAHLVCLRIGLVVHVKAHAVQDVFVRGAGLAGPEVGPQHADNKGTIATK